METAGRESSALSSVEELGFALIHSMFCLEDLAPVTDVLGQASLRRSRAGVRHALSHPAVAALASDKRLLEIARPVLGQGAVPFRATLFDKSPSSNWLVAWHQDTALPLRERRESPGWGPWSVKEGIQYAHAPAEALSKVLALRVHLDDSTERNGPLRVLPATHTLGVLTDDEIHALAGMVTSVQCALPRGGIIAVRPLLIHASSKSQSAESRRVLHIEYAAALNVAEGLELAIA